MTETTGTVSPHFGHETTARTYAQIHLPRIFTPWAKVLLEVVPAQPGESVLDVATGPGTVAREVAARVGPTGRVVGVDISGAMLAEARALAPAEGAAPLEYIESSADVLALASATFDVAYCQQGLQHMADPHAALRQIRRVLKSSGRIGVAVWAQSPFGLFREVLSTLNLSGGGGPQPTDFGRGADDLAAALRSAGFTDVEVQTRDMVSVLEGGVDQAVEMALATSSAAMLSALSPAEQRAARAAFARALERNLIDGRIELRSVANIGRGNVPVARP